MGFCSINRLRFCLLLLIRISDMTVLFLRINLHFIRFQPPDLCRREASLQYLPRISCQNDGGIITGIYGMIPPVKH